MSRNGTGTMTVPNTFVASTRVLSADVNENFSDIASEITNSLAIDGQSSMSGQIKAYSGTITLPGISWASETGSGWYRAGTADFRHAIGGSDIFKINSVGVTVTGTMTVSGAITGTISTATNATNLTTASAGQGIIPSTSAAYYLQSATGQTNVNLTLRYNGGASIAGYLYGSSSGLQFLNSSAAQTFVVDNSGNATAAALVYSASGGFKFPDSTIQTTAVSPPASGSVGAVGTYGFFRNDSGGIIGGGATVAGSSITYSDASNTASGTNPSGTWRCMGYCANGASSVFLRTV